MKVRSYEDALKNRVGIHDIDCQAVKDKESEDLCEQSHKKDCDINEIVRRHEISGYVDEFLVRKEGVYGDFTQFRDYQENLNTVIAAQDAFDSLRAEVRKRFDNDPMKLMEFLSDKKNREEAIKLGLVNAAVPAPTPANSQESKPVETPK